MSKAPSGTQESNVLIEEKVDVLQGISDRFRRQVQQAISLQKKINILLDEFKRLQISLKTTHKEFNLEVKNLKESATLFTEAVDPNSSDWKLQYELRKAEDSFQETYDLIQLFFENNILENPSKN